MSTERQGDACADRVVLSRQFRGTVVRRPESLAPYVSTALGIRDVPATRIEAACASSGSAFFHAWTEVAAGVYDVVMVVGVEKMTSQTDGPRQRDSGGGGRLLGRDARGRHFPGAVRHDRAPAHARVRDEERAPGGGRGEESRQRRAEPRGAHAEGDHAGAGDGRQADRRPVESFTTARWSATARPR